MKKPARNEPCHCGSGKKYKKCCIGTDEITDIRSESDFMLNFSSKDKKHKSLLNYNKVELIKILAYLQLLPQNHGKSIRIEKLITELCNSEKSSDDPIDINQLRRDLKRDCTKHQYEDPPEDFFTENIIFVNGNNTVYPGNFTRATEIVQSQLDALVFQKNIPFSIVNEIVEATLFLLTLHNTIAEKLGHSYRIFEAAKGESLYIPENYAIQEHKDLFLFSYDQLVCLCEHLHISSGVINEFVIDLSLQKITFSNPDSNPLFEKPFVRIGDQIILAVPTAELAVINNFIIRKIKEVSFERKFVENYLNVNQREQDMVFGYIGWSPLPNDILRSGPIEEIVIRENLYQFDANKISYVLTLAQVLGKEKKRMDDFTDLNKRLIGIINSAADALRTKFPSFKLFLIIVLDKCDLFENFFLDYSKVKNYDQYIALNTQELSVLPRRWKFDTLTLWKYAAHIEEHKNSIQFMPQNTHLSRFNWYKENFDCFFHPDDAPINFAVFDFDIEGDVNRRAKAQLDKIGIPYLTEKGMMYLPSRRKEEHYPVFISDEFRQGFFRNCLMIFKCPLWLQCDPVRDYNSDVYINGILYWLFQASKPLFGFFDGFGTEPIVITLSMDEAFKDKNNWDIFAKPDQKELVDNINVTYRSTEIFLPISLVNHLMVPGNAGEKFLMSEIVKALRRLMISLGGQPVLSDIQIEDIFEKTIYNPLQKMIILAEASDNPIVADIDVDRTRFIQNADISYVLHHQLVWLENKKSIPKKIQSPKEKTALLNELVALHFRRLVNMIGNYNELALLDLLMNRHESLIQAREMRKLSYPTQQACYSDFYDVFDKFSKSESEIVSASLTVRLLIEFVVCERPTGREISNDADIDLMLAHMSELVNYGAISDTINFGIDDTGMGLLASGRLGIDTTFANKIMAPFKNELYLEEFDSYKDSFGDFFSPRKVKKANKGDSRYFDRVDEIFIEEWGINIWDVVGSCKLLCMELFDRQKSVDMLTEGKIIKLFSKNSEQPEEQTRAFLKLLTFRRRNGVLNTDNNALHETFPWRYNRRVSYMLKPLIKFNIDGADCYLISARHLLMAGNNMVARFFDGTLKVDNVYPKILNLLAERNHIKGGDFRDSIVSWLNEHTKLKVLPHEVKIKPKGFFPAESDKGDVDILAIDEKKKIIYAIECKNTSQAKIAYDIFNEVQSYIGIGQKPGMIEKHVHREIWLKENIGLVHEKLGLTNGYQIKAFVLTKHILPTKYISKTKIPVYSLSDLKANGIFVK